MLFILVLLLCLYMCKTIFSAILINRLWISCGYFIPTMLSNYPQDVIYEYNYIIGLFYILLDATKRRFIHKTTKLN